MSLQFYVIDTETTGLSPAIHEIVEISIIRCSDRNQITKNIKALRPEKASFEALKVINKSYKDIVCGEDRETVVNAISSFLEEDGYTPEHRCMVAHNAVFDKNFCHALWTSVGKDFPAILWLDTKPLVKAWAVKQGIVKPKLTLAASLEFCGLKAFAGQHNAKSDARNAWQLWKKADDANEDILPFTKRYPHSSSASSSSVEDYLSDI